MNSKITEMIKSCDAYALATTGPHGVNVVPISVVEVKGDEIHLYDFFMRKTADNIKSEPEVAFVGWRGFSGLQIKARAVYETAGEVYEKAVTEMKERFPDRTLAAVIRLTPTAVYDVAPGAGKDNLL